MAVFGHSGSQAPQLIHSSVIIVAILIFLQVVHVYCVQFWGVETLDIGLSPLQSGFRHRKPVHNFLRELLQLRSPVGGPVAVEFAQAPRELARRSLVIAVEEMVEADRNLDQTLKKEPVLPAGIVPQILERVVTLKITPVIKLIDAAAEQILVHYREYKQITADFLHRSGRGVQILKYRASG